MKIHNNSIYVGNEVQNARHRDDEKADGNQRKTLDGRALQARFDPVMAKKEDARRKAMKIVGDAFAKDRKIDEDLDARREKIRTLQSDMGEAKQYIRDIEDSREELRKSCGVDVDSQEEKDLKLLEKEVDAKMPGSKVSISKDERKQIEEIKAKGLTEYQKQSLQMKEEEIPYARAAYEAEQEIKIENQIISTTQIEREKTHTMIDAEKKADAIMDAASKEIVGMLVDESKEHIDEESEEKKKEAKEKAEKKEELEAQIEKTREKRKEAEEVTEEILEGASEVQKTGKSMETAKQEMKEMLSRMKLIEDDIKGAAVDTSI